MVLVISLLLGLVFPEVLTQRALCIREAKNIDQNNIKTPAESVRAFLILLCAGRKDEAEKVLKNADGRFPDDFLIKFNLGNFYIQEGKLDFAIFYLNQARRINPVPHVFESLATAYIYRGDLKSARKTLDEAVEEFSKRGNTERTVLHRIHMKRGFVSLLSKDHAEAERSFRKAIEADPTDPYSYVGLAESLIDQGKDRVALEVLSRVKAFAQDPIVHLYSAAILHTRGYLEMATEHYVLASENLASPLRYVSKLLLGSALRDLGFYLDARESIEEVRKYYPNLNTSRLPFSPEYRLKLAAEFIERGNIKGAETEIREVVRLSPENQFAQKVLVDLLLMRALLFSQREEKVKVLEEAREFAKRYIDRNPSDDEMLYRFALINFWLAEIGPKFARSGNIMHAISSLQSAVKLREKPEYIELLGVCYYVAEKYDDAISELQKVANRSHVLKVLLSSSYLKAGNPNAAKKVLTEVPEKRNRIYALMLYNIAKQQRDEGTTRLLEQIIIEENYERIMVDGITPEARETVPVRKKEPKSERRTKGR